jgi:hypothetical protein
MTSRTAEEQLEYYKINMGPDLGILFHYVYQELSWTSSVWDAHEVLFGTPQSVKIMNGASGVFSVKLQTVFFEYSILGVCKLLDKAHYSNRKISLPMNSIRAFPDLVSDEIRSECNKKISLARKSAVALQDWRDRKIAHSNLLLKTKEAIPLKTTRRVEITEAIIRIHDVLKLLCDFYCNSDLFQVELGDFSSKQILYQLLRAEEHERLESEANKKGDYNSYKLDSSGLLDVITERRYDINRISKIQRD